MMRRKTINMTSLFRSYMARRVYLSNVFVSVRSCRTTAVGKW